MTKKCGEAGCSFCDDDNLTECQKVVDGSDSFLRDIAMCICAMSLLMVTGACIAVLLLRFSPAFWQLFIF